MAITSWAGWQVAGSSPAPIFLADGTVRIEDPNKTTNARLRLPVRMSGGQRIRLSIEARVLSGRGYLFADLIAEDRTETIMMRSLDADTRAWRSYEIEIACPRRYDQDNLVYVSLGTLRADTGIAEYRNWRVDGLGQQILSPYVQDGWARDPATGGLQLLRAHEQIGVVAPGDRLTTFVEVQAAIDARFDSSRDVDARAYIARAMPGSPDAVKDVVGDFIAGLKTDGVWTSIEHLYLINTPTITAALTDVIRPSERAQVLGGVAFDPYIGAKGNSADGQILSANNLSTRSLFKQNDAHMAVAVLSDESELAGDIGAAASGASAYIAARSAGTFAARLNGSANTAIAIATAVGFHIMSRSSSAEIQAYVDGVKTTVSSASTAVSNANLCLMRSGNGYSPRKIAMGSIGSNLSETQAANYKSRWNTYQAAMAAFVGGV